MVTQEKTNYYKEILETSEHKIFETPNNRFSVESKFLGRITRSNIRELSSAKVFVAEAEGTLVACDQVGFSDDTGTRIRPSKTPGYKRREIGEFFKGYIYLGGSTEGLMDDRYSIWLSAKNRYSFEKKFPERAVLSGLSYKELMEVLQKVRDAGKGKIAFQQKIPGL